MAINNITCTTPRTTFQEQMELISQIRWHYRQSQVENFLQQHRDKTKNHTLVRFQYDPLFVALVPTDYLESHDGKLSRMAAERFTFITLRDPPQDYIERKLANI